MRPLHPHLSPGSILVARSDGTRLRVVDDRPGSAFVEVVYATRNNSDDLRRPGSFLVLPHTEIYEVERAEVQLELGGEQ